MDLKPKVSTRLSTRDQFSMKLSIIHRISSHSNYTISPMIIRIAYLAKKKGGGRVSGHYFDTQYK